MEAASAEGAKGGFDCRVCVGWTVISPLSSDELENHEVLIHEQRNCGEYPPHGNLHGQFLHTIERCDLYAAPFPPTSITGSNAQNRVLHQTRHPHRRRRRSHNHRLLPRHNLAARHPAHPSTPSRRSIRMLPLHTAGEPAPAPSILVHDDAARIKKRSGTRKLECK